MRVANWLGLAVSTTLGMLALHGAGGCSSEAETAVTEGAGASASTVATGGGTAAGGAGGVNAGGSASTSTGVPPPPTEISECQGHVYECGDLVDNDNDGLIDYQDPDCLGPCDNTEDSLFGGIPGQNASPCTQDCYFDQDTGQGNDQCYWSHWCDPNSVAPNYYPEPQNGAVCAYDETKMVPVSNGPPQSCADLYEAQSQNCYDYCGPLTPNGCDCFGCCDLSGGQGKYVWLGSVGVNGDTVCTYDQLDNPDVCHPCLPVKSCLNECDPCELCIGKTELPPECDPGEGGAGGAPPSGQCPEGVQACGLPDQPPCPSGQYCITGCCQIVPD